MTQEEALLFLELPDTASAAAIKTRIQERMEFYEMQSEKAPSDFLRRLSKRNFEKVQELLKASQTWPFFMDRAGKLILPAEVVETPEQPEQTVYIVASMKEAVLKEAEKNEIKYQRERGAPAGWLIKHMESQEMKTYPVVIGENFIGRKQQPSLSPFIVVEGDDFISRVQCVVYAEENDNLQFYVSDPSAYTNGKTSKNGTFINGKNTAVTEKVKLADGDTIQVGVTKLVLRLNTAPIEKMLPQVTATGYMETVVLDAS